MVLKKLARPTSQLDAKDEQVEQKLQHHLGGKKFLVVLDDIRTSKFLWRSIKSAFADGTCSPGSAILVTTWDNQVANSLLPCNSFNLDTSGFYMDKAVSLVSSNQQSLDLHPVLGTIITKLVVE